MKKELLTKASLEANMVQPLILYFPSNLHTNPASEIYSL